LLEVETNPYRCARTIEMPLKREIEISKAIVRDVIAIKEEMVFPPLAQVVSNKDQENALLTRNLELEEEKRARKVVLEKEIGVLPWMAHQKAKSK